MSREPRITFAIGSSTVTMFNVGDIYLPLAEYIDVRVGKDSYFRSGCASRRRE